MLECVVNFSEGRDASVIQAVVAAGDDHVLDVHTDPDHHRTVVTLAGPHTERKIRAVSRRVVELIDIAGHSGVHPRFGALDVVPFVPLDLNGVPLCGDEDLTTAISARDEFARWAGEELRIPCFCYGPERSLPEVRSRAFIDLAPDFGPVEPHPSAGCCAVGARHVLVAYNLWLSSSDLRIARNIASAIRNQKVRALGLPVGGVTQVSCNLLDPLRLGPEAVYDAVEDMAGEADALITRAELVGLAPSAVVEAVPVARRRRLDLDLDRTVESRLAHLAAPRELEARGPRGTKRRRSPSFD